MWKERTGSFSRIYTSLHQQGKMLNTEWGDKTNVSSLDLLALLKSRAVLSFGNLRVLHVRMSTLLEIALCVSSAQSMNSGPLQAPAGSVSPTCSGPVLSLQHQSLVVSEAPVTE